LLPLKSILASPGAPFSADVSVLTGELLCGASYRLAMITNLFDQNHMLIVNNTGFQKHKWSHNSQLTLNNNIAPLRQVKLKYLTHPNKGCLSKIKSEELIRWLKTSV
jgi:hypothetical protein